MTTLKVTMFLEVSDDSVEHVKKLEHHAEHLLDFGSFEEQIFQVYGVTVEELPYGIRYFDNSI